MTKIAVGIIGAAGYTAGELIRILLHHPQAEIAFVHSESQAGKPITSIHQDLVGETSLLFSHEIDPGVDALFVCSGHGRTQPFLAQSQLPSSVKIIDLSNEFRIEDGTHSFVYGLPEWQRERIQSASYIANPGCFATAIQLALLPLAENGHLAQESYVTAITGSTGAGQQPTESTHFSWRSNNLSVYKPFTHQHLPEISQSITQLSRNSSHHVHFVPIRGDFARGIFATTVLRSSVPEAELIDQYESFYQGHPFTHLTREQPHLKQVVNTNKALIHLHRHEDQLLITSVIDNLLKGASGQAVQNFNLLFGLDERAGLQLKGVAF